MIGPPLFTDSPTRAHFDERNLPGKAIVRTMTQPTVSPKWQGDKGRRRSMRVLLTLPVKVYGISPDAKKFEEDTHTLVVNAHGALVTLVAPVAQGQSLTITNKATLEKLECRAVFVGHAQGGRTQVGLEFLLPSSSFWQINFPPEDWKTD